MISIETLPSNLETYGEMKQLCSNWEHVAEEKMAEHATTCEMLFKRYAAAKNVCTFSLYRFHKVKKKSLRDYYVDIAYDSHLNIVGFALSKIITLQDTSNTQSYRFLFLHFLTSDPNQFESNTRIKNIATVILKRLQMRCIDQNLDGIFSEPVLSVMPLFHAHKFVDTELKKGRRRGVLLSRTDFEEARAN